MSKPSPRAVARLKQDYLHIKKDPVGKPYNVNLLVRLYAKGVYGLDFLESWLKISLVP